VGLTPRLDSYGVETPNRLGAVVGVREVKLVCKVKLVTLQVQACVCPF